MKLHPAFGETNYLWKRQTRFFTRIQQNSICNALIKHEEQYNLPSACWSVNQQHFSKSLGFQQLIVRRLGSHFLFNWYKMLVAKWKFDEDTSIDEVTVSTTKTRSYKKSHQRPLQCHPMAVAQQRQVLLSPARSQTHD